MFHPSIKTYYIKDCLVAIKENYKDLGIIISNDLSWGEHHDYVLAKAYKVIGLLRRTLAKTMSIHTKKVLYISLIKSTLTYRSPIWHPQYLKDIQTIENVQRRVTSLFYMTMHQVVKVVT